MKIVERKISCDIEPSKVKDTHFYFFDIKLSFHLNCIQFPIMGPVFWKLQLQFLTANREFFGKMSIQ